MRQIFGMLGICTSGFLALFLGLVLLAVPAEAQRRYNGQLTSCPEGTRPIPQTDNCVPIQRQGGGGFQGGHPGGLSFQRPGSTVCFFNRGLRRGKSFDFRLLGFKPIPIGSPCNDGLGSTGTAGGRF